ncbi:hypothetical protein D187_004579 [Cystobacter fuscus DSM 2262]|uniref:Uncharacterized protein n=1 Tax=Cystobacter fuscus (strain ATCC 25194 / DSM 2262 / NBRC 100088 / M29) TaxID=1242864 RepID=S9PJM8_CYSF2|nr:hypothetical protein D187_004579 [Cystobacter fuscus DSM 2262]
MNTHSTASHKDTLLEQLLAKNLNDTSILTCGVCIACLVG